MADAVFVDSATGVPLDELPVLPHVGGAAVSGTNPLPVAAVFADANGVPFSSAHPLPVQVAELAVENLTVAFPNSVVSAENSRTIPLAANEEFVGSWVDCLQFAAVQVAILTDAPSVPEGASVEFSDDGTMAIRTLTATVPAGVGLAFTISPEARYVRFRYRNGPTAQTLLRAQVLLSYQPPVAGRLPLGAVTTDLMSGDVSHSHLRGRHPSGAWLPIATDGLGNLSITGTVALAAGQQIALDAASLAALESITTAVSGTVAVTGTVTVSNLPATQPVSGTVSVANLPDTQPVSGTVEVSNLPATQAVSGPLTNDELRGANVDVADDYDELEVLADQAGGGSVLTFTFSAPVNLAVVHAVGASAVARAATTQTPTPTLGIRCPDDVPTFMPVTTNVVSVFAPSGMTVSCYGYRRS